MDYEVVHDGERVAAFVRPEDAQLFAEEVESRLDRERAATAGPDHVYPVDIYIRQLIRLTRRSEAAKIFGAPR